MSILLILVACGGSPALDTAADTGSPPGSTSSPPVASSPPGSVATTPVAACLETYSVANGYGFEAENWTGTDAPTLEAAEDACAAAGAADCEVVVTHDAAVCIAELEGLAAGLEPWLAFLVYHHDHEVIVWNVQNLEVQETGYSAGTLLALHAGTGDVLDVYGWSASP